MARRKLRNRPHGKSNAAKFFVDAFSPKVRREAALRRKRQVFFGTVVGGIVLVIAIAVLSSLLGYPFSVLLALTDPRKWFATESDSSGAHPTDLFWTGVSFASSAAGSVWSTVVSFSAFLYRVIIAAPASMVVDALFALARFGLSAFWAVFPFTHLGAALLTGFWCIGPIRRRASWPIIVRFVSRFSVAAVLAYRSWMIGFPSWLENGVAAGIAASLWWGTRAYEAHVDRQLQRSLLERANADRNEYSARLRPLLFKPAEGLQLQMTETDDQPSAPRKLPAIMRELRKMRGLLPIDPEASIFLRYDKARPHALQALVSGPVGTPYSDGLFLFDIVLPPTYPSSPPKVRLLTTGSGRARFNPNLYESGKVCLSILGTWPGPSWSPSTSSILQVLVSVQSLVMVKFPYFNEPGTSLYDNPNGDVASAIAASHRTWEKTAMRTAQNGGYQVIRGHTLRYAVLEMMKHPPKAFKEVVQTHFQMRAAALHATINDWIAEARTFPANSSHVAELTTLRSEFLSAVAKLPPLGPIKTPGTAPGAEGEAGLTAGAGAGIGAGAPAGTRAGVTKSK